MAKGSCFQIVASMDFNTPLVSSKSYFSHSTTWRPKERERTENNNKIAVTNWRTLLPVVCLKNGRQSKDLLSSSLPTVLVLRSPRNSEHGGGTNPFDWWKKRRKMRTQSIYKYHKMFASQFSQFPKPPTYFDGIVLSFQNPKAIFFMSPWVNGVSMMDIMKREHKTLMASTKTYTTDF